MHYEYVYKTGKYESRRHRRNVARIKVIIFVVSAVAFGYYMTGFVLQLVRGKNNVTIISPIAEPVTAGIDTIQSAINYAKLREVVTVSLEGAQGTYGVYIKNLKTGEKYAVNENRKFASASLYKLWVMVTAFNQIESGKLDPEKILQKQIVELNDTFNIATEDAELTEGTLELSVKRAINQMIVVSNNYAALALTEEVKASSVSNFLRQVGLVSSKLGDPPSTTARDIGNFYEKLYAGQLATPEDTGEMLEILKSQQLNDRIPKYLPEAVKIAHKTGELNGFKHDAGIVFTQKGDYIIVLMSETKDPQIAAAHEASLSKSVYEYFETRD